MLAELAQPQRTLSAMTLQSWGTMRGSVATRSTDNMHTKSARSSRMRGGCGTCMGTCGSGVRTPTTTDIEMTEVLYPGFSLPLFLPLERLMCCGAVRGTTTRSTRDVHTAMLPVPQTVTTILVFVCCWNCEWPFQSPLYSGASCPLRGTIKGAIRVRNQARAVGRRRFLAPLVSLCLISFVGFAESGRSRQVTSRTGLIPKGLGHLRFLLVQSVSNVEQHSRQALRGQICRFPSGDLFSRRGIERHLRSQSRLHASSAEFLILWTRQCHSRQPPFSFAFPAPFVVSLNASGLVPLSHSTRVQRIKGDDE